MNILVSNFYKFIPTAADQLPVIKTKLKEMAKSLNIGGLFLIGTEGINATISGKPDAVSQYKTELTKMFGDILFKDNDCDYIPFRSFMVKVREEIVTLGRPDIVPQEKSHHHISPDEWNRMMKEEDVVVIDTRNWYEYEMGKFKDAIHFNIDEFSQYPEKIKQSGIPKDKNVLIYCTGGIRCEKAIYEMEEQGYKNVFQLDGGIITYLQQHPNEQFEGECFVFDRRCAVDQNLKPTEKYAFCPHCGQPADTDIECSRCDNHAKVCQRCRDKDAIYNTCSKNCAHHAKIGTRVKKKLQSITRQELHKQIAQKS